MTATLHVHRYGPPGPARILALHGLTGHGQRWQHLAGLLPEFAWAAPDLVGHGRSSWSAPWTIDANISALADLLDAQAGAPVLVVGHSFGAGLAMHLAAVRPDRVAGLLLLDPAIGLDGAWMREIAEAMLASPDYPDAEEARLEKLHGSWSDVEPALLDAEIDEHLIELPNGRYGWRVCLPAMMSYWSELARDPVLPPAQTATILVRASEPRRRTSATNSSRRCRTGWDRGSGCWISTATTWCPTPSPTTSPRWLASCSRRADVAPVTDEQVERVRALVAAIPPGRVATYGDIAAVAGLSSARIVGWIMRTDSSDLPWHRVITASGRPARHLRTRQLELLRAEGVLATDGRIPLPEVRHRFGA